MVTNVALNGGQPGGAARLAGGMIKLDSEYVESDVAGRDVPPARTGEQIDSLSVDRHDFLSLSSWEVSGARELGRGFGLDIGVVPGQGRLGVIGEEPLGAAESDHHANEVLVTHHRVGIADRRIAPLKHVHAVISAVNLGLPDSAVQAEPEAGREVGVVLALDQEGPSAVHVSGVDAARR